VSVVLSPSADPSQVGTATRRETPLRRQYQELKQQHPDCILLFQLGDFYESFEDDAAKLARACGVALTSREFGKGDRVALAGVPVARLDAYLARLVNAGLHVAVADQVSPPGSGLVERAITRVVTPGTVVEPGLLRERENRYLAALVKGHTGFGLAYVDVSTGEFGTVQVQGHDAEARVNAELQRLGPAEILVPDDQGTLDQTGAQVTAYPAWHFGEPVARQRLLDQYHAHSLASFGCDGLVEATAAAGALLAYLDEHDGSLACSLAGLRTFTAGRGMPLDPATRRNLELVRSIRSGRLDGSLLSILDRTRTPMGGRLLRAWLGEPLLDRGEIEQRQDAIEACVQSDHIRPGLLGLLGSVGDLERWLGRIARGVATPRELLALVESLRAVRELRDLVADMHQSTLWPYLAELDPCPELIEQLDRGVALPGTGRTVRAGYNQELDAVVEAMIGGRKQIAQFEQAERQRTGIRSLKVGFNRIFGYYLEVTRPHLAHVPDEYQRRQTLTAAERFVTPALKDFERRILSAEERVAALEREVYQGILDDVSAIASVLRRVARAVAHLDVFVALAEVARSGGWCRPCLTDGDDLDIRASRHPVVEASLEPGAFIPNDCRLDRSDSQILMLTGPNMAGKSTYLRQVALVVLLAQIGAYVPAEAATIGMVDRIFTRVGAQDDIAGGASTFMVEMSEMAAILRHATSRSLLLLDEVGRGTSTVDGLSIAQAIVEHAHDRIGARTLFATHFHELSGLAAELPRLVVFHTAVAEDRGRVVFLRHVEPGPADRSYGIHVARLAGLPDAVTDRADGILRDLERTRIVNGSLPVLAQAQDRSQPADRRPSDLEAALLDIDLATTTPLEALNSLARLQQHARAIQH
jgi:DNA mismatch repair protein MutS